MVDQNLLLQYLSTVIQYQQRNNGYLARQEIDQLRASLATDHKRLEHYGYKVYSQGDEDGIIEEIFKRLNIKSGQFCEIGVENGLECNSLFLIHKGWRGTWIEGNENQIEAIYSKFNSIIPQRLNVKHHMVSIENVNKLIAESYNTEAELDFLSIDIDGNDIYLFDALDIRPKVICIEYNAKFPANISKAQIYDPNRNWQVTDYMGSSLKAIREVASKKGYRLVGTNLTGSNAFFVRDELCGFLFSADSSSENLYNPPRYYLIFDHYTNIGHRADFGPYVDLEN